MAKGGDKRRLEANSRKLALLRTVILGAIALHVVFRLVLFRTTVTKRNVLGLLATVAVEGLCYRSLSQLAVPTYGPGGELIDGGADLTLGGVTAAYFDALYIAAFVQVTTILSGKFWLVLLVIPAYGAFQLWKLFAVPKQQERPETASEKARKEKAEKRATRRSQRYA